MPTNRVAENVFGTIGTICWTVQLVPQIWKSWRTKSTEGLSEYLVLLWGISAVFLGVYAVVQNFNVPLIVQPQLFATLSYMSWAQCLLYGRRWSKLATAAMYLVVMIVSAGFQVGMVYAVRPSFNHGNDRPVQFFGAVSTVLLSVALLPQYYEIYKYKEVIGISTLFILVDMAGGVFSDLSLAFKEEFDVVAGVSYSLVVVLDGIVIICAMILNPRAKRRRKRLLQVAGAEDGSDGAPDACTDDATPHGESAATSRPREEEHLPGRDHNSDAPIIEKPPSNTIDIEKGTH